MPLADQRVKGNCRRGKEINAWIITCYVCSPHVIHEFTLLSNYKTKRMLLCQQNLIIIQGVLLNYQFLFLCTLIISLSIQSPYPGYPGQSQNFPVGREMKKAARGRYMIFLAVRPLGDGEVGGGGGREQVEVSGY